MINLGTGIKNWFKDTASWRVIALYRHSSTWLWWICVAIRFGLVSTNIWVIIHFQPILSGNFSKPSTWKRQKAGSLIFLLCQRVLFENKNKKKSNAPQNPKRIFIQFLKFFEILSQREFRCIFFFILHYHQDVVIHISLIIYGTIV